MEYTLFLRDRAVGQCVFQQNTDQFIAASARFCRDPVELFDGVFLDANGECPVTVFSFCPLRVNDQVCIVHITTSNISLCLTVGEIYVNIYVIKYVKLGGYMDKQKEIELLTKIHIT